MTLTRNQGCQPGARISACGPFSPSVAMMCSPGSEVVPYILLSTCISSDSTWTYEVAARQVSAITTKTMRRERESVRKSGRARLTKRPRRAGATAARKKYRTATTTQNIKASRRPLDRAASAQNEFGSAEPGNLHQDPVAGERVLDRNHAAGHHDHAAPQRRPRGGELPSEPGERVQRM